MPVCSGGYLTLTCYDVFALRAIGRRDLPYRVAALASFTSYTIGHNIGAAVLTSGIIRYRIYSAWGLSVGEIARIAFITGLTYWLGNAFVLGCGIALAPGAASAINHLPAPINRLIGLAALTGDQWLHAVAIAAPAQHRPPAIGGSRFPIRRRRSCRSASESLDLIFVTLAMYVLLPAQPAIDLLGFARDVRHRDADRRRQLCAGQPRRDRGGDVLGLPQFPREDLLASLLTFRLLYFVVPLILASLLFGLREARLVAAGLARSRKVTRLVSARK